MCGKDINQSFTFVCIKEMHPLPLIKSQVLLFTVIRVEQMHIPKNSRDADPGEMPQASAGWVARGAQTGTSLSLSREVKGSIPGNLGLCFFIAKWPHPGNTADAPMGTSTQALPVEWEPLGLPVMCSSIYFVLGSPVSSYDSSF